MSLIEDYSDTFYADGTKRPNMIKIKDRYFIDEREVSEDMWFKEQRKDTERLLFDLNASDGENK